MSQTPEPWRGQRAHTRAPARRPRQAVRSARRPPRREETDPAPGHPAMKIAMLTTAGQRCGIASYSEALVAGLRTLPDTDVQVIPIAVGEQPASHYEEQAARLNAPDVDLVHIQHESSLWGFPTP